MALVKKLETEKKKQQRIMCLIAYNFINQKIYLNILNIVLS